MSIKYSVPVEQTDKNKIYKIFEHNDDSSMFLIATSYDRNYAIIISSLLNDNEINYDHLDNNFNISIVCDYTVMGIRKYNNSSTCSTVFQILEHRRDKNHPTLIANSNYLAYAAWIVEQLRKNINDNER